MFFLSESATRKNKVDDQDRKTIQPKAAIHANNSEFELISFFVLYVCIQTFSYRLFPLSPHHTLFTLKNVVQVWIFDPHTETHYMLSVNGY